MGMFSTIPYILYSTLFLAFRQCKKIYKNTLFTFFNHNYTKLPTCYSHIVDNFFDILITFHNMLVTIGGLYQNIDGYQELLYI